MCLAPNDKHAQTKNGHEEVTCNHCRGIIVSTLTIFLATAAKMKWHKLILKSDKKTRGEKKVIRKMRNGGEETREKEKTTRGTTNLEAKLVR